MLSPAEIDFTEQLVLTCVYCLLYIIGVPLLIWRSNVEPIRSRCWILAVLQAPYCVFDLSLSAAQDLPPCFLRQLDTIWALLLWIYPYSIRQGRKNHHPHFSTLDF